MSIKKNKIHEDKNIFYFRGGMIQQVWKIPLVLFSKWFLFISRLRIDDILPILEKSKNIPTIRIIILCGMYYIGLYDQFKFLPNDRQC